MAFRTSGLGRRPTTAHRLAQREQEIRALTALSQATSGQVDTAAMLVAVGDALATLLPTVSIAVVTYQLGEWHATRLLSPNAPIPIATPIRDSLLDTCAREQRTVQGGQVQPFAAVLSMPVGDARWIAMPLQMGDSTGAMLVAAMTGTAGFTDDARRVLEHTARQLAAALEHDRLHREMRQHVQQIETLREIVESISSELEIERLLERIVAAAVDLLSGYGGAVGLLREPGDALELAAMVNIPEEQGTLIPAGTGVMGLALSRRAPVVADDYAELPAPIPLEALYRLAPWIAVPIFWQGSITGVFGICAADRTRRFGDADIAILSLFAKHAGIAIENARLYQRSRELAVTEERNRLAREIHDTLAQSLTGMVLHIGVIDNLLDTPEVARAELRALQTTARTTLDEARRSVWGLRPPVLEDASLAEALERILRDAARTAGFSVRLSASGRPRQLAPALEAGLYRVAQEAITNVQRHAQARSVVMQLRYEASDLVLVVQDDGRGLTDGDGPRDESEHPRGSGFGLTGMQERVRLLGGTLHLASEPGRGTRVEVRVPYYASTLPSLRAGAGTESPTDWPIRVLVVDDHDVARHGIVRLLERHSDIVVVAEAASGRQALELARRLQPDVMLVDIQMPDISGIEVIETLGHDMPTIHPIILTTYARDDVIFEGVRAGAQGFLLKDITGDELARAVRTVNQGQSLLQPVVATRLMEQIGRMARTETERDHLTAREFDVLTLLVGGARNKEISAQLGISHGTVRFHISNIFQKLGVSSRTEAVRVALRDGLVSAGE